ncbi:MAG: GIY-YIG nuclease family protein [bacterium]|nr:GIY-YIG nuclease family protein [bacterium]
MKSIQLKKLKLPDTPGVYFFRDKKGVLYIGKATSLKDRVKSYFNKDLILSRGPRLTTMLEQVSTITWQETDSVLEALLLETALIKKHQPKYNAKEKDDKSYWHIVITKEDFPQVLQVRGRDLKAISYKLKAIFGPFVSGSELKEALKIIRKIFPYRDGKCKPNQNKPCFNRQIGLCPGICTGEISKSEYAKIIRNLKLFFNGKKVVVVKNLEREMKRLAKAKEFERAAKIRNQIFALNHIRDVALIKDKSSPFFAGAHQDNPFRIEAYDIAHTSGKEVVGVMTVVEGGEPNPNQYRKFKLSQDKNDDTGNLAEVLSRRLNHPEWPAPNLVVVDGGLSQLNAAKKVFKQASVTWLIVVVVKDERHKAKSIIGDKDKIRDKEREILLANSEAHRFALRYHRQRRGKIV